MIRHRFVDEKLAATGFWDISDWNCLAYLTQAFSCIL